MPAAIANDTIRRLLTTRGSDQRRFDHHARAHRPLQGGRRHTLTMLADLGGAGTIPQLADGVGVHEGTLRRNLTVLEREGRVTRHRDSVPHRYEITDAGQRLVDDASLPL